jgi:PDZ domain-containing protein
MDQSKIDATTVVLHQLAGYPKDPGNGAVVEFVYPGCPAESKLFAGDLVQAIDGTPVHSQLGAAKALDAVPAADPVTFTVSAGGKIHHVTVTRSTCVTGSSKPLIGINLVDAFPFGVQISSGDVGGPSAGLMWALGLYDLLTPGDLTRGKVIAGTGTIDTQGNVGPIGGIQDKVVAAERAGAQVFLVPRANMADLRGVATGSMRLVPVSTFEQALEVLAAR